MKRRNLTIIFLVLFVFLLIFIERGPWGSEEVAKYNQGYGTFDMKSYNPNVVYSVLDQMEAGGFDAYKKYFICDNLFIVVFCIFQLLLQSYVFQWSKSKWLHRALYIVPVARMLFDLIENITLAHILQEYPLRLDSLVIFSSIATKAKLYFVGLWPLVMISGIVIYIIKRRHPVNQGT